MRNVNRDFAQIHFFDFKKEMVRAKGSPAGKIPPGSVMWVEAALGEQHLIVGLVRVAVPSRRSRPGALVIEMARGEVNSPRANKVLPRQNACTR